MTTSSRGALLLIWRSGGAFLSLSQPPYPLFIEYAMSVPVTPLEKETQKLIDVIKSNPGEAWDRRVKALQSLAALFEE